MILLTNLFIFGCFIYSACGVSWKTFHTSVTYNNKLVVYGGQDSNGNPTNEVYVYDIGSQTWLNPKIVGSGPATYGHASIVWGSSMYVYDPLKDGLFALNLDSFTWQTIATTGVTPNKRMNTVLCFNGGTSLLAFGGSRAGNILDEANSIDLTNLVWVARPNGFPKNGHSCTTWNNVVYELLGESPEGVATFEFIQYNANSNQWMPPKLSSTDIPARKYHSSSTDSSGKVYIFGGERIPLNQPMNDFIVLDLNTGDYTTLKSTGTVPSARFGHSGTLSADGTYYFVFGGSGAANDNSLYIYNVKTNVWSTNSFSKTINPSNPGNPVDNNAANSNNINAANNAENNSGRSTNDANSSASQKGLSIGTIIGMLLGILFAIASIIFVTFAAYKRKREKRRDNFQIDPPSINRTTEMKFEPSLLSDIPETVTIDTEYSTLNQKKPMIRKDVSIPEYSKRNDLEVPLPFKVSIDNIDRIYSSDVLLNRYKVESRLEKEFHQIFFTTDIQTNKKVVIKVFQDESKFTNEATILQYTQSKFVVEMKNIYQITDLEENSRYLICMECCGDTLEQLLKKKKNTMNDHIIKLIVKSVADCIDYFHSQGLVYCDLKPSNIIHEIGDTTSWKLIDFESVKFASEECVDLITPRYCPPEVARATLSDSPIQANPAMDIWAFGCIIYEMYTGKSFMDQQSPDDVLDALSNYNVDQRELNEIHDFQARNLMNKILIGDYRRRISIKSFLKSAYLNSGLDTIQQSQYSSGSTDKVFSRLLAIERKTDAVLYRMEADIPRMFIICPNPEYKTWSRPSTWGKSTFKLHLLCEHDTIHLTDHSGYSILDPKPFLRKVGPLVGFFSRIIVSTGCALHGTMAPFWFNNLMEKLGRRPTEYLSYISNVLDEYSNVGKSDYEKEIQNLRGPALRELQVFLEKNDPAKEYGNLYSVITKSGEHRWVCQKHMNLYKPIQQDRSVLVKIIEED